jgi:hypothetical protein
MANKDSCRVQLYSCSTLEDTVLKSKTAMVNAKRQGLRLSLANIVCVQLYNMFVCVLGSCTNVCTRKPNTNGDSVLIRKLPHHETVDHGTPSWPWDF